MRLLGPTTLSRNPVSQDDYRVHAQNHSTLHGFFGGAVIAFALAAAIYCKWGRNQCYQYQYVPDGTISGNNEYQEYYIIILTIVLEQVQKSKH
jgi:hypothetical protein